MTDRIKYLLQIADNALINGHRLSEWCGHGPVLEQDIALANIAMDHLGQSRSLYQYAAEEFNSLPAEEKAGLFASAAISQHIAAGEALDEDDLAFLRDGWDFRNLQLLELPNKDWAYTIARSFFFDVFNYYYFTGLSTSSDSRLAAIAGKSLKEITYHLRWSSEWVIRLGDGTEESHARIQQAIDDRWAYTGEMFKMTELDSRMLSLGIAPDLSEVARSWSERVSLVLEEATLSRPQGSWMQDGGKEGRHTEHLGYLLAEMQFMQRAYPNMEW